MRGLFVLLTLLVASFSHAELNGEWVFEFSNGNRVYFSPERGAFFQVADAPAAQQVSQTGRILRFESTGPNQFEGLGKATENGVTARIIKSRKASSMFFAMTDGIFVLNEKGVLNKITEGSEIALPDRDFYMDPGPENILANGKKIRAVALRIPEGDGFRAAFDVVDSELTQGRRVSMAGLEKHAGPWKFKIELLNPGTDFEIISYQIEGEGKRTVKRHYSRHWDQAEAFELYEKSAFRGRDAFYGTLGTQTYFTPVIGSGTINTAQLEAATTMIIELVNRSAESMLPITKIVPNELLVALQIQANEMTRSAAISGVLQYNPIESKDNQVIDEWIRESYRVKGLSKYNGFFLFQKIAGQTFITLHPKGSGAHLQSTLNPCDVMLGLGAI